MANACEALGRIGDIRAKKVLLKALSYSASDARPCGSSACYVELASESPSRCAGGENRAMQQDAVNIALKRLLKDPSSKVRLCASLALYELGEKSAGQQVVKELEA